VAGQGAGSGQGTADAMDPGAPMVARAAASESVTASAALEGAADALIGPECARSESDSDAGTDVVTWMIQSLTQRDMGTLT